MSEIADRVRTQRQLWAAPGSPYKSFDGMLKGIEFARYSIHIHALRNYCFVRLHLPERFDTLVPAHVRKLAEQYGIDRLFDAPEAAPEATA